MPEDVKVGCARPTGGPVGEKITESAVKAEAAGHAFQIVKIGKKAPDFAAPGYLSGNFISVQLSEYLGKWVLLCFYPGDFTFV